MHYRESYKNEVAESHADYRADRLGEPQQDEPGGFKMRSLFNGLKHRLMRPAIGPMVFGAVAISALFVACEVPVNGDIVINTEPLPAASVDVGEKPAYDPIGEVLGALQDQARQEQEIIDLSAVDTEEPQVEIIGDLIDFNFFDDFDDDFSAYDDFSDLFVEGDYSLLPVLTIDVSKPAPKAVATKSKKVGLVFDGGDKYRYLDMYTLADNMAADGDRFTRLLESLGYTVTQHSQWWESTEASLTAESLQTTIERYGRELKPGDSLFINFSAHGNQDGFSIYYDNGDGTREWVKYSDFGKWLDTIDNGVNITILINACKCGGAIPHLKGPNRTIITATDADTAAIGAIIDTFTEDFVEAFEDPKNADTDKDGVVSLREAFKYAEAQGSIFSPQFMPPTKPEKKDAEKGKNGVSDDSGGEAAIGAVYSPVYDIGNGNDDHALCDAPQGGFQCGAHMQWWLDNHEHVTIGNDVSEVQDEEKKPAKKDENNVGGGADSNDDHALCDVPQGGFQCGNQYLWWLDNHDHVTIGNDVPEVQEEEKKPENNVGGGAVNNDGHSLCDVPQGGFQCGNQYLWWLNNHDHVTIGNDVPEVQDEEKKPEEKDENNVGGGAVNNDDHAPCDVPQEGFQCGNQYLWWLDNHEHVTIGNDVPEVQDEEKKPEAPKGTGTTGDDKNNILVPGGDNGTDSSVNTPAPSTGPKNTELKTNSGARVKDDPNLPPGRSYGLDTDGDGRVDVVVVGTLGGKIGKGGKTGVTVSDPDRTPDRSFGVDADGDGTTDFIIVGTKGAKVGKTENGILIIEDSNLPVGRSYEVDVDGDYEIDIRVIGTREDKVETNFSDMVVIEFMPGNTGSEYIIGGGSDVVNGNKDDMPGNVFNIDNTPAVEPEVVSGCGGAVCDCNYFETPTRVPDMYMWGVDFDGDGIPDIIRSTTNPALPFPGVQTGIDTDGDGYFDSLLMPQGTLGPCDKSGASDEDYLEFGIDLDGDGLPDSLEDILDLLNGLEEAPMKPATVTATPTGVDLDGDGYPDALEMPQGPLGPAPSNTSTSGNNEVDLTKISDDELFDLFLSTDVSDDLWKILEEIQRRDSVEADAFSGNTVTLANPALTAVETPDNGGAVIYTNPDSNGALTTVGKKILEEGLSMGAAGIDDVIKTVGYNAATGGWLDDATKARMTGAGVVSTTMKVAGKGLIIYGVYSGLDRAANATDEGEVARGLLDATWSAVPGPIGIAGAVGNAAGQQIEKIDTGTATADGGSTVHDWLTAAGQEYFEGGFFDTFVDGWRMILR